MILKEYTMYSSYLVLRKWQNCVVLVMITKSTFKWKIEIKLLYTHQLNMGNNSFKNWT